MCRNPSISTNEATHYFSLLILTIEPNPVPYFVRREYYSIAINAVPKFYRMEISVLLIANELWKWNTVMSGICGIHIYFNRKFTEIFICDRQNRFFSSQHLFSLFSHCFNNFHCFNTHSTDSLQQIDNLFFIIGKAIGIKLFGDRFVSRFLFLVLV